MTREDRVAENDRLTAIQFGTLECAECDAVSVGHAPGWHAYLADDPSDWDPVEVAVFCPECAEWESGL